MPFFIVVLQVTLLPLHTCTNTHRVIYLHEKDIILCPSLHIISSEKDLSSSNVAL